MMDGLTDGQGRHLGSDLASRGILDHWLGFLSLLGGEALVDGLGLSELRILTEEVGVGSVLARGS